MSIFEKKQGLSQTGKISKPEKAPPPVKQEKKDTSAFGGKSIIGRKVFNQHLKDPKLYQTTRLEEKARTELGKKLFGSSDFIKKTNIPEIKRQLDLGRWGKFKDMSSEDKRKAKIIIKEVLGE